MATGSPARVKLQISREGEPGATRVSLSGTIDETLDGAALVSGLGGVVVFDLDGVQQITSFGVRGWVRALESLTAEYFCFVKVRPALVTQFNMVSGFAGHGQLVSFYWPAFCNACQKNLEVLLDLRKDLPAVRAYEAPLVICSCGARATFDDDPESYFAYAAHAAPPSPPALAITLIEGGPSQRWRVEKEVAGGVTGLWCSGALDRHARLRRLADGLEGDVVMVLDRVTSVDEEGANQLLQFAASIGFRLHLSHLPLTLVSHLARARESGSELRLLSFRVELVCRSCGKPAWAVFDSQRIRLAKSTGTVTDAGCPVCSGPLELANAPMLDSGLPDTLPPPAPVLEYLRTRPDGPGQRARAGEVLGRYRLGKKIGMGGMAEVFLARQSGPKGFEKRVVVKRLLPGLSRDGQFVQMFLREARLAARLSHPNIVQIFDLGQSGTTFFIAMEYVRGWDLNAVLRAMAMTRRSVPVELGCRIIADVCAGLGFAHRLADEQGRPMVIVHRDVSPQNILVSDQGTVKITDFGIAKAAGAVTETRPNVVRGKLAYMAPEQLSANIELDGRADIFSAGVVLFELLTGQRLFHRETQQATSAALFAAPIPRLDAFREDLPPTLNAILAKALARERDARYARAEQLQADLEEVIRWTGKPASPVELEAWLDGLARSVSESGGMIPISAGTPTSSGSSGNFSPVSTPGRQVETPSAPDGKRDRRGGD